MALVLFGAVKVEGLVSHTSIELVAECDDLLGKFGTSLWCHRDWVADQVRKRQFFLKGQSMSHAKSTS